jgi:hypothetical protein
LYGQAVTFFSRWLEAEGRAATLDELNRAAIRDWLAGLSDTHEPGTVKVRYRGLHRFCSWLVDEDELPENPNEHPVAAHLEDEAGAGDHR